MTSQYESKQGAITSEYTIMIYPPPTINRVQMDTVLLKYGSRSSPCSVLYLGLGMTFPVNRKRLEGLELVALFEGDK